MAVHISYSFPMAAFPLAWVALRTHDSIKLGLIELKREFQLIFVRICIVVVKSIPVTGNDPVTGAFICK